MNPLIVMGTPHDSLQVRGYVDEILIHRLADPSQDDAPRCSSAAPTSASAAEFVRVQPYVSPKIELSDQRQERVDLRVLPVIFRFEKPEEPQRSIPGSWSMSMSATK